MTRGKTVSKLVRLDDVTPQAWKNGAGTTRELLAGPSPQHWQYRISVANIDRDAPFSAYPHVQRWFTVIDGAGVALRFSNASTLAEMDATEQRLTCGDPPLRFDGDQAPHCRLLSGPTRDLNLMLRGVSGGMYRATTNGEWRSAGPQAGLFSAHGGQVELSSGKIFSMPAMSLLWFEKAVALTMRFQPGTDANAETEANAQTEANTETEANAQTDANAKVDALTTPLLSAWWLYCGG